MELYFFVVVSKNNSLGNASLTKTDTNVLSMRFLKINFAYYCFCCC